MCAVSFIAESERTTDLNFAECEMSFGSAAAQESAIDPRPDYPARGRQHRNPGNREERRESHDSRTGWSGRGCPAASAGVRTAASADVTVSTRDVTPAASDIQCHTALRLDSAHK